MGPPAGRSGGDFRKLNRGASDCAPSSDNEPSMACAGEWVPWGVARKSPSGIPDPGRPNPGPRESQGRAGGPPREARGGSFGQERDAAPKKKRGRVPAYTPALRQRRSGAWGLPRLELPEWQRGPHPLLTRGSNTGGRNRSSDPPVYGPRGCPSRFVRRPERRDSKDAMQEGPTPGGRGSPHGIAPSVPDVRLSLGVAWICHCKRDAKSVRDRVSDVRLWLTPFGPWVSMWKYDFGACRFYNRRGFQYWRSDSNAAPDRDSSRGRGAAVASQRSPRAGRLPVRRPRTR